MSLLLAILIAAVAPTSAPAEQIPWLTSLEEGYKQALRQQQPILVCVGAVWCGPCHKLKDEMAKPAAQQKLAKWTLVYLDADKSPQAARALAVEALPALRVLTSLGETVASTEGFMTNDELLPWLDAGAAAAAKAATLAEEFIGTASPDEAAMNKLLAALTGSQPALREAAIRRLSAHPRIAAAPVVEIFADGKLEQRLAVLDLLMEWNAPVNDLDPWRPETITAERLAALKQWATHVQPTTSPATRPSSLREDFDALLAVRTAAEALAIRERLIRNDAAAVELELNARLRTANTDAQLERLTALQLRLAASDRLALSWPGGIERLASTDTRVRHDALGDFARRATADDAALLLRLFASPDALVRETSLRLLRATGADASNAASAALAKLLSDPEPNVRAAVLKQWAEHPDRAMARQVAEYVATEADPDLLVHAIRVLRAAGGKQATQTLIALLKHENWRVRAEAAEALHETVGGSRPVSVEIVDRSEIWQGMEQLLDDPDGFVISRAIMTLLASNDKTLIDPIFTAAEKHPELLPELIASLNKNSNMRAAAKGRLEKLARHEMPGVRASVVRALCSAGDTGNIASDVGPLVIAALADPVEDVRIAAAGGMILVAEASRPSESAAHIVGNQVSEQVDPVEWLKEWRGGKRRPRWMSGAVPLLEKMIGSERSSAERVSAAVALVMLGNDSVALPILHEAARSHAPSRGQVADALAWLAWEQRLKLFNELVALSPATTDVQHIAAKFADPPDPRAAPPLWSLVTPAGSTPDLADAVLSALRKVYFGQRYYNASSLPASTLRPAIEASKAKAKEVGASEMQRLVALALLLSASGDDAAQIAQRFVTDPSGSNESRLDAFQVQLLALPRPEAEKVAAAALASSDTNLRKVAVPYLASGSAAITQLRGTMYLYSSQPNSRTTMGAEPITVAAPAGVTVDLVKPLLNESDQKLIAYAGYLLAVLGDRGGLDILIKQWRENARSDEWTPLVYRAISSLNDDELTPVLAEIYQAYDKSDTWEIRQFYWTIRSISGPKILKLRKRIRDEVGMENLK